MNSNFHTMGGNGILYIKTPRFPEHRRKWREWPKNFRVETFDTEVQNKCNLRCLFCVVICGTVEERGPTLLD